jgi:hypothetical protein
MTLSRAERAKVDAALRNSDGPDVNFSLKIEGLGLDVGEFVFAGDWGADSSGVISTDLTFSGRLPLDYDDTRSTLSVFVEDVEIPQMVGHVSLPEITEDKASTEFFAASAGAEAGRVDLGDLAEDIGGGVRAIEFNGWAPERILRRILRKLPYPSSMVRVDPLKEPLLYLTRARQNNFWPEQYVSDVLSVIQQQTPYTLRDTPDGGFVATPTLELSDIGRDTGRIYNAADFIKWRPPPRSERRYSEVVVYKRNDAGIDLFPPVRATVPYRTVKRPPLGSTAKYISLDDESPDAQARARRLAHAMASRFSRGVFAGESAILPFFDPLIEIGTPIWVDEEWEDLAGFWDRSWLLWVDTYKHSREALTTEIGYTAALMENERIESPAFIMPGVSDGVARLLWGEYGDYFYIDESMSWIADSGDYFTIDETLSGGVVTQSGDYFTVN